MSFINSGLVNAINASGSPTLSSLADAPVARVVSALAALAAATTAATAKSAGATTGLPPKIPEWQARYTDISGFLTSRAGSFASEMGMAQQYRTLNNLLDGNGGVGGCAEIIGVSGFFSGQYNGNLELVAGYMEQLTTDLTTYVSGALNATQCLNSVQYHIPLIDGQTSALNGYYQNELNLLDTISNFLKGVALAQQLSQLWDNPCTQAIMGEIIPAQYQGLLNNPVGQMVSPIQSKIGFPNDFGNLKRFGGGFGG